MKTADFEASLASDRPPAGLAGPLQALWWDAKGAWDKAHAVAAADEDGASAAWVHAYLHRKEGDASNARYWYRRADRPVPVQSLDDERRAIVAALLARNEPA